MPLIVRPGTKGIVGGTTYEGATSSGGAYEAPTKAFSNGETHGKTHVPAAAQCGRRQGCKIREYIPEDQPMISNAR